MDDTTKLLHMVRMTLNEIEVRGRDNMDKLLGCINALETIEQILAAPEEEKEEVNG